MEVIGLREAVLLAVVEHTCPVVVGCRDRGAESDRNLFKAELVRKLLCNRLVALVVELAAVNVGALCLDAEDVLSVLLVRDANVNVLAKLGHSLARLGSRPELAAVVEVAGYLDALFLCRLTSLEADVNELAAECGSDAREVEPIGTVKDRVPIEVGGLCLRNRGMRAVVDTNGTSLGRALFEKINAHAVAAADDFGGVNAEVAEGVDRSLTDSVLGELGHVCTLDAEIGKRNGNVCLAAAEGSLHLVVLEETVVSVGCKAKHNFAECYNLAHLSASIFASASFTKKLPPIAAILSKARNSSMLERSTPPVGMNLTCGKGPERALSAERPP